jgi:hypothetical protein
MPTEYLREHGGNQTPIANPFAHWDPNFDQNLKVWRCWAFCGKL